MTAGPARRMVTLLPKNKPTPMAPPMAIMVSWRWPRRRWRPSTSVVGGLLPASVLATIGRGTSVMTADTGRVKDHKIDVLLENVRHRLHVVHACCTHGTISASRRDGSRRRCRSRRASAPARLNL